MRWNPYEPIHLVQQLAEARAGAHAVDRQGVLAEPADHVEVDHGGGLAHGHDGIVHVVAAAPKTPFLAREENEDHRAVQLLRPLGQGPGDLQHHGLARGVVVGPVINRPALGRQRAIGTVAQVIVMGAQHDRLVGQRAFAGQNGGNILHFAVDMPHVGLALDPPALQLAAGRLERMVDLVFDRAEFRFVQIAENAVDHRPATRDHRQVGVGEGGAGDVERQQRVIFAAAAADLGLIAAKDCRGRVVLAGVRGLVAERRVGRLFDRGRFLVVDLVARLVTEHDRRLAGDVHLRQSRRTWPCGP